jgi:hypothetical protein
MATYTSIINSVLRRLRESTVAAPTSSDYALLIGEFVNETKREVEDAWKWTALRTTIPLTTANGTSQYSITGAGDRFKLQDPTHSVYNATTLARLLPQKSQWLKEQALLNTSVQEPAYYYIEGKDGSGDPYINFYSTPDAVYTINVDLVLPQASFSVGTEVLSVPEWPVVLGTYAKAIAERGEDNGKTHGEALNKFGFALSDAVAMDESLTTGETTWYA